MALRDDEMFWHEVFREKWGKTEREREREREWERERERKIESRVGQKVINKKDLEMSKKSEIERESE